MHIRLLTFVLISFAILNPCRVDAAPTPSNPVFKIGVILPLSGEGASLGNYVKNGLQLALNSQPESSRAQVKLLFEDDQLKATRAVAAAHKFIGREGVKALIVLGSGAGNAIAPIAERSKTLLIAVGASDPKVALGRKFSFTHWVTPEAEADLLAAEVKARQYKKAAFITHEHEGFNALRNATLKAFEKQGLLSNLVFQEILLPDVKDFKTTISKARSKEADVVVVGLFPGALAAFAKQARDLDFKVPLIGFETFEDENEVKASDGALIGSWYVNASASTEKFIEQYQTAYKHFPGWGAANAFDCMNLVYQSLNVGAGDTTLAANFLRQLKDYKGAAGKYSASGDNRFNLPAQIKVVKADGFAPLER